MNWGDGRAFIAAMPSSERWVRRLILSSRIAGSGLRSTAQRLSCLHVGAAGQCGNIPTAESAPLHTPWMESDLATATTTTERTRSSKAGGGNSRGIPDERSDIRGLRAIEFPHVADAHADWLLRSDRFGRSACF